jgi:hypothetical protein
MANVWIGLDPKSGIGFGFAKLRGWVAGRARAVAAIFPHIAPTSKTTQRVESYEMCCIAANGLPPHGVGGEYLGQSTVVIGLLV